MAPSDETRATEESRRNAPRSPSAGSYPAPHQPQNGPLPRELNPFHLAMAELEADQDFGTPAPQPAAAANPNPSPFATEPFRTLGVGGLATIGGVALICGLVGGSIANALRSQKAPAPDPTVTRSVQDAKAQTDALAQKLDGLSERLAALPKPAPAPDLSSFRTQLDKTANKVTAVEGQAKVLDSRADQFSKGLGDLRSELVALRAKLDSVESTANATRALVSQKPGGPDAAPKPEEDVSPTERNLSRGADLFKQGKYREAMAVFNKLEVTNPDDARVWYFAALCNGLSTNQWSGATALLVEEGIKRERAGTPDATKINAAFDDLTVNTGKDWLAGYRQRAKGQ